MAIAPAPFREADRSEVTTSQGWKRIPDLVVAFNLFAALAALAVAVVPAVVANRSPASLDRLELDEVAIDGEVLADPSLASADVDRLTVGASSFDDVAAEAVQLAEPALRGSVSAYWDVGAAFSVPFLIAAVLLILDAILSYISSNKRHFGQRWYNGVLGLSLIGLVRFNVDDDPTLHYLFAGTFFILFLLVMTYTAVLGSAGRRLPVDIDDDGMPDASETAEAREALLAHVGFLLVGAAIMAGISWAAFGWITFYFFELHALVTFALFFALRVLNPFPYRLYEFPWSRLNSVVRFLRLNLGS